MKNLLITTTVAAMFALSVGPSMAQTSLTPKPVQLKPLASTPINLHMNEDSKAVYQALGKTIGLTIVFDPDYISKVIQFDITDANATEALHTIGLLTNTFPTPVTPDTILVAPNSRQKHQDLELDAQYDQTFYLKNATQQADANEVVAALRNMLPPETRVYLVMNQNALVVHTTADNMERAQKLLADLDKPKKTYRLTYTVTEVDGTRKIGSQRFAMVLADGQKTSLNQSSRVPVATGSPVNGVSTQYSYEDGGTNFEATLYATGSGAKLNSKVTQSSLVTANPNDSLQAPVRRDLTLEGSSILTPGKPLVLGSMDVPGSTRHLDIEVVMEQLP
jgi:type II secretory pathway component GspD/PulD (secretin)